jgi:hypothetical protein
VRQQPAGGVPDDRRLAVQPADDGLEVVGNLAAPPVWTADATTVAAASAVGQSSPSPSAACTASFRPPCPADNWPPRVIAAPVWAGSARRSTKWLSVLCAVVGPEPGRVPGVVVECARLVVLCGSALVVGPRCWTWLGWRSSGSRCWAWLSWRFIRSMSTRGPALISAPEQGPFPELGTLASPLRVNSLPPSRILT